MSTTFSTEPAPDLDAVWQHDHLDAIEARLIARQHDHAARVLAAITDRAAIERLGHEGA